MPKVGIVMGSDSDLAVMKDAADVLQEFGIDYEITICSAHRLPEETARYAATAIDRGLAVIIAGAGGAAHLPGVIAASTLLPVIGVPIQSGALAGVDALYAIVQMPRGIPVATVAINGSANAALLAVQMLAMSDPGLRQALQDYRRKMARSVLDKNEKLQQLGVKGYLER
ncbi:MAG: 5-(carboxyamino)imidazole ribonucleotide mutase [Syntrophomonadaceae bacterium]|jgi:5-(carboxyamino)imidazole ribonucleotide mutase|nr:5-(carboxyamino)imidazole ribonucleotide mutase [Syntrophomonadaceae bacterium]